MKEEYESIIKNKSWELVELAKRKRAHRFSMII